MMYRSNSVKGFSLIELIVVMAIMSVLMSLSGGLFQKSISQQERHVELEQVNQLFRKFSYEAYFKGYSLNIILEKSTLRIVKSVNDKEVILNKHSFKQLTFVAQKYQVSAKGVTSPITFAIMGKNTIKHFNLESIFNETSIQ